MEAMRVTTKPKNGMLTIKLPESLATKQALEVIILPAQENQIDKKKFNPSEYYGVWKEKNIDVEKVCEEMREEWNHDF